MRRQLLPDARLRRRTSDRLLSHCRLPWRYSRGRSAAISAPYPAARGAGDKDGEDCRDRSKPPKSASRRTERIFAMRKRGGIGSANLSASLLRRLSRYARSSNTLSLTSGFSADRFRPAHAAHRAGGHRYMPANRLRRSDPDRTNCRTTLRIAHFTLRRKGARSSSISVRSRCRARDSRDITVPIGMASTRAACS